MAVTYKGGPVLVHPNVQAIFLGSGWVTNTTLAAQKTSLETFMNYIYDSEYFDILTNCGYGVGRGKFIRSAVKNVVLNKTAGVKKSQIEAYISGMIDDGTLLPPSEENIIVVFVEQGCKVLDRETYTSSGLAGFHSPFLKNGSYVYYAAIVGSTNFALLTRIVTHECIETVTDPAFTGWSNENRVELGDLAGSATFVLNGFTVTSIVNKVMVKCTNKTVMPPIDCPKNLTAVMTGPNSVKLKWNMSNAALGYRVYAIDGDVHKLLADVNAVTTEIVVNNIVVGSQTTFKVESYNRYYEPLKVLATPAEPQLQAPVLSGVLTDISIKLNWTLVAGAEGYKLYRQTFGNPVLVANYGPTQNNASWGYALGVTYNYTIKAFHGSEIVDSNTVTITTPSPTPPTSGSL